MVFFCINESIYGYANFIQKEEILMINSIKPFELLEFTDDYIFYRVMQNDEICKELLEHLLKVKIDHIVRQDVQKELKPFYESKGIRLDAYIKDSNRIFNIEMQQVSDDELPKRSRYYSSMIDTDSLLKGKDYTELAECFIVFICSKDPFKKGLPVYTFENMCLEDKNLLLNDMSHKIFFNASAYQNEKDVEIKSFLDYIITRKPEDNLTNKINTLVQEIKSRETDRRQYMIEHLKIRDKIMEGKRLGIQEKAEETAVNFLKEGDSVEKVARCIGLPLEKVQELAKEIKQ